MWRVPVRQTKWESLKKNRWRNKNTRRRWQEGVAPLISKEEKQKWAMGGGGGTSRNKDWNQHVYEEVTGTFPGRVLVWCIINIHHSFSKKVHRFSWLMTASRNPVNATNRMKKQHLELCIMTSARLQSPRWKHFTGCVFDFYSNQPPGGDQRASVFPKKTQISEQKSGSVSFVFQSRWWLHCFLKKTKQKKTRLLLIIGDEQSAPSTTALQMPQNIT